MSHSRSYGVSLISEDRTYRSMILLCEQLGICYEQVTCIADRTMPVAVVLPLSRRREAEVLSFVSTGGAVLTGWDVIARLGGSWERRETTYSKYCNCHEPFQYATRRWGQGFVVAIDEADLELLHDHRRQWHWVGVRETALAIVPCTPVQKGAVHRFWRDMLLLCFQSCELPLVHRWYFPGRSRTHFTIRIDADWYDVDQWRQTRQLLKALSGHASWFITCRGLGSAARDFLRALAIEGSEVGSHGFVHHTFRDWQNNSVNLGQADTFLRGCGVVPLSFVSPSAKWNEDLQRAVEQQGYVYSSEFSYAHDCYPLWPRVEQRQSSVLQVPVHPTSPGNFTKFSSASPADVWEYYAVVARSLHAAGLPLHLYGHPADLSFLRYGGVNLVEEILSWPGVTASSLLTYAQWWRDRCSLSPLTYEQRLEGILLHQEKPGTACLCLSWEPAALYLTDEASIFIHRGATRLGEVSPLILEQGGWLSFLGVKRQLNPRSLIGEWLDYESLLPSSDYVAHNPRTATVKLVKLWRGL